MNVHYMPHLSVMQRIARDWPEAAHPAIFNALAIAVEPDTLIIAEPKRCRIFTRDVVYGRDAVVRPCAVYDQGTGILHTGIRHDQMPGGVPAIMPAVACLMGLVGEHQHAIGETSCYRVPVTCRPSVSFRLTDGY